MRSNELVLDFETANPILDLSEVGSTVYSKHWATEILCLGVNAGGTTKLWRPSDLSTNHWLYNLGLDHRVVFIAHNVGFEKDIWRNIMVPKYGFPDVPNHRWHDTMAIAFYRELPGKLEKLLLALGLPGKDMKGNKLTLSLSRYDRKGYLPKRTPELMQRVYAYCLKDVADEVAVHELLGYLPPAEWCIWDLDQEINERGLRFDLHMVRGAIGIYHDVAPGLVEEFREITGVNPTQRDKVLDWVRNQGVEIPDLRKETITDLIGDFDDADSGRVRCGWAAAGDDILPPNVRRALTIRALIGSSSVTKYARMEKCIDSDGRIFRLLQYHGAGTGRWAGRLTNPHNMPRGIVRDPKLLDKDGKPRSPDAELLAKAITSGNRESVVALGLVKDDGSTAHPIEVLASALRHTVISRPGHVFLRGDWSNIEARIVLAIAGQRDKIALMVSGHDVYLDMACTIYHVEPGTLTKADVEKRQIGKNTVLGCGFGMGWDKFRNRYCPKDTPKFAKGVVDAYRNNWAPKVPGLWRDLQDAALSAVQNPGRMFDAAGMEYRIEGGWLVAHCPDGSTLYYYLPTLTRQRPRWKEITETGEVEERVSNRWVDAWKFQVARGLGGGADDASADADEEYGGGRDASGRRGTRKKGPTFCPQTGMYWVKAYGGLMVENYIQHMARQILCGALVEAKRQGLDVVLHNHDELVLEVPEWCADPKILQEIMEIQPAWLKPYAVDPNGRPLNLIQAECFEPCTRYHK
jgi:DNA polymerase